MPPYGGRERGRGRRSVLAYPVVPSPDRLSDRTRWRSAGFWSADQRTVGRRLLPIDAVNEERWKSGVFDAGWRRTRHPRMGCCRTTVGCRIGTIQKSASYEISSAATRWSSALRSLAEYEKAPNTAAA